jgi:uncharacterized membrane protein YobD (UPF0266 family)
MTRLGGRGRKWGRRGDGASEDDDVALRESDSIRCDATGSDEREEASGGEGGIAAGGGGGCAARSGHHMDSVSPSSAAAASAKLVPPSDDIDLDSVAGGGGSSGPESPRESEADTGAPSPARGASRQLQDSPRNGRPGRKPGAVSHGPVLAGYGKIPEGGAGGGTGQASVAGKMHMVRDVYVRSAVREAWLNKCNYLLGFIAVFLSVTVVVVVNTGYEYSPLFFLSIAQYNVGEVDAVVTPGLWTNFRFLNYSKVRHELGNMAAAGRSGRPSSADAVPDAELFNYSAPRHVLYRTAVWPARRCAAGGLDPANISQRYFGLEGRSSYCGQRSFSAEAGCMAQHCGPPVRGSLFVIDSELEQRMGLGQRWNLPAVARGHAHLQQALAQQLNVSEGDVMVAQLDLEDLLPAVASPDTLAGLGAAYGDEYMSARHVMVPLRIQSLFSEALGKFDQEVGDAIVIEYEHFFASISAEMVPSPGGALVR